MSLPANRLETRQRLPALAKARVSADWRKDLASIERQLAVAIGTGKTQIEAAARRGLLSGGKRVRPLLTCALLRALGKQPEDKIRSVVAVEMAHAGSLLHDDIIDETSMRRGGLAAHVAFDVPIAVLAGDRLVMLGVEQLARCGPRDLLVSFCSAIEELCLGESLEREKRYRVDVSLEHIREVNRMKTASLFGYAAEAGAILAGAAPRIRSAAQTYGLALGQAFQTTDDCLDLQGDPQLLGKPVGQDLISGLITLPVALALEREPSLRDELLQLWDAAEDEAAARVEELRARMAELGAFASTLEMADQDAKRAASAMRTLPASPWRDHLIEFAKSLVSRLS
jgi:octaprenyl-diphosphate synthase